MTCNLHRKQSYSLLFLKKKYSTVCASGHLCFKSYISYITWRLVLWSEKGELKKHVTMLMTVSVT